MQCEDIPYTMQRIKYAIVDIISDVMHQKPSWTNALAIDILFTTNHQCRYSWIKLYSLTTTTVTCRQTDEDLPIKDKKNTLLPIRENVQIVWKNLYDIGAQIAWDKYGLQWIKQIEKQADIKDGRMDV